MHPSLNDDQDLKNIYHKMIDYLSTADMSETRLVNRVCRLKKLYPDSERYRNYTEENCRKVIGVLREEGLVNEQRYAERLFHSLRDKKDGLYVLRRKMLQRAIQKNIVDAIIHEFTTSGDSQDLSMIVEATKAKKSILQKKYANDAQKDRKVRFALQSWLVLKGYRQDDISAILSRIY